MRKRSAVWPICVLGAAVESVYPMSAIYFELLVPSKVQLQKSGTVFQSRMISYATLRQSSRIGKQYANMLEEYVVASFRSNYLSECY